MLGLYFFTMNEFDQVFNVLEYDDFDGIKKYRIEMEVRINGELRHAKCLVDIPDRERAYSFADRLNKHWDDIYRIPRWIDKFIECQLVEWSGCK